MQKQYDLHAFYQKQKDLSTTVIPGTISFAHITLKQNEKKFLLNSQKAFGRGLLSSGYLSRHEGLGGICPRIFHIIYKKFIAQMNKLCSLVNGWSRTVER